MNNAFIVRAVGLWVLALAAQSAVAAQLVFAQVAPQTGRDATQGRAYGEGLQLAFNNANRGGGLNGHTLSLVRKDDGGRVEDTLALTKLVLSESKPLALTGYFGSRNVAELVKSGVLDKEKIPLVGYRTTELRTDSALLFGVRAGLRDEINKITEHLATVGITRLGFFFEEGSSSAALVAAMEEAVKRTGASILVKASYPAGSSRVTAAIDPFLKQPPQAIVMVSSASAAASFIEEYRLGGGVAQLFAHSGTDIEQLAQRLGEQTMQGVAIAQVTPSPYKMANGLAKEFADIVAKTPNLDVQPSYAMMEGFIAGKTIAEAVRRMGAKASREGFLAALEAMDVDLGGYRIAYKAGAQSGSRFVELSIVSASGKIRQ
jgi:ABC-type branched-subunit amino acid transport system substrate-binding protein